MGWLGLLVSLEICVKIKNQQLESDMEKWTGSKLGKEYIKTGSRRSPGVGNDNLLQNSCLENSIDRGACWAKSMGLQRVAHD